MSNKTGVQGKLSPEKAKRIRELYATGKWKMGKLAKRYGVWYTTISHIVRGEAYRDAGGPISTKNYGRKK